MNKIESGIAHQFQEFISEHKVGNDVPKRVVEECDPTSNTNYTKTDE
jgi:hypothetical protein